MGTKIRVSFDNTAAKFESSPLGGTCQGANQAIFMASALDLSSRNG
jgi:hypothetical protein